MATWFGKYNKQGFVVDSNGIGSSSDNTSQKKATQMFSVVQSQVLNGVDINNRNKSVRVNGTDGMTYANNHDVLLNMKKGQSYYYQDCSNSEFFSDTYVQTLNPDPCHPQVVVPGEVNTDISNNYAGMTLMEDCSVVDSSCVIYEYAEIKTATDISLSDTDAELLITEPVMRFDTKVYFGDFANDC